MKKMMLILSAILAITVLGGCGSENTDVNKDVATNNGSQVNGSQVNGSQNSNLPVQVPSSEEVAKAEKQLQDYKDVINSSDRSVDDCNELTNDTYKDECLAKVYTKMAEEKVDDSVCNKISIKKLQDECVARVKERASIEKTMNSLQ